MVCKPIKRDLLSEFRKDRGQTQSAPKEEPVKKKGKSSTYESFWKKYIALDETIDSLNTMDLVYYFREIAQESGYKYVIANFQKDMAIMKRLKVNYSNREICGMIEFLYMSEQDYLDKSRLSPNILASQWVNTVYADMKLWVDDKYVNRSTQKDSKRKKSQHEWSSDETDFVEIGGKL